MTAIIRQIITNNSLKCGGLGCSFTKNIIQNDRLRLSYQFSIRTCTTDSEANKSIGRHQIYTGKLKNRIRNIKFISCATSVLTIGAQPMIYLKTIESNSDASHLFLPFFTSMALLAVSTPILIHMLLKGYIIRIDYDPDLDKYFAVQYGFFPIRKEIEFVPEDVESPTVSKMFANILIKGKPAYIDPKSFSEQKHFVRIMGWDKPVDLKQGLEVEGNQTELKS